MGLFTRKKVKKKKRTLFREDVTKRIMPNRCELCSAGIGKTMLFYNGTWRPFTNPDEVARHFYYETGRVKVCSSCYERLERTEDPAKYIKENAFKT